MNGLARHGRTGEDWTGMAWAGEYGCDAERLTWNGTVRPGALGSVRAGKADKVWTGWARAGWERRGRHGWAWLGQARSGEDCRGEAVGAWRGRMRQGEARRSLADLASQGLACAGTEVSGVARLTRTGADGHGESWTVRGGKADWARLV